MREDNRELEVKFPVSSVDETLRKLAELHAECEQPMQYERNLRFEDDAERLSKANQVLRLRDNGGTAVLTFKADRNSSEGLADREEIETAVDNFERTRLILERLGFHIFFIYEKYRTIYTLDGTGIFIDHTPIGDYIEIEGPDEDAIHQSALKLGLDWESRSGRGYKALFKQWKKETGFTGRDMTFADIESAEQSV